MAKAETHPTPIPSSGPAPQNIREGARPESYSRNTTAPGANPWIAKRAAVLGGEVRGTFDPPPCSPSLRPGLQPGPPSGDKLGLGILERLRGLTAPVRYRERRLLLGLERDLLRQHDVAGDTRSGIPQIERGHRPEASFP
jgi:hypothetical protein